jgi:dTDP-4-dehydrorhamnose reductase
MNAEKINILVTGSRGQLGSEINFLASSFEKLTFTYTDMPELDLSDESQVKAFFDAHNFDVVIHCAAYTAVDNAEDEPEKAFSVNAESVRIIAEICQMKKIRLIHISTDYVFDGESNQPLDETATPRPLSVYGQSKLKAEQYITSMLPDAYIIRTAWVYSSFGRNFVKTISNLARQRSELNVVADQIGAPTYAHDLAGAILYILESIFSGKGDHPGIYHYTNEGVISWYDLAHFIIRFYKLPCTIKPIRTEEYKTKAIRPRFSLLSKRKIGETFGIYPPHWHDSLLHCLEKMEKPA